MTDRAAPLRLGVLASGGGSNLQAIIDACAEGRIPGVVAAVVSNNSQAGALERARRAGIPAYHLSNFAYPDDAELDRAVAAAFRERGVELVLCAGYMKKRGAAFLRAFPNRVLNIHPALLPGPHGGPGKYGIRVHESVLAAGERVTGVTIHLVDEEYDHGPVIATYAVDVLPGDTASSLQARVLAVEHLLYPAVVGAIARGAVDLDAVAARRPASRVRTGETRRPMNGGGRGAFPHIEPDLYRQIPASVGPELLTFIADWGWQPWADFLQGLPADNGREIRQWAWAALLKIQRLQLATRRALGL